MSRPYTLTLEAPAGVAAGAAVNVMHLTEKVVTMYAYTSGTYQLQVSGDGVNFVNFGTAFTAAGLIPVPFYAQYVRLNATVGGTAAAHVSGVQTPD